MRALIVLASVLLKGYVVSMIVVVLSCLAVVAVTIHDESPEARETALDLGVVDTVLQVYFDNQHADAEHPTEWR